MEFSDNWGLAQSVAALNRSPPRGGSQCFQAGQVQFIKCRPMGVLASRFRFMGIAEKRIRVGVRRKLGG